jgi:hypothetical protein
MVPKEMLQVLQRCGRISRLLVCGYQGGYRRLWGCDAQARKIAQRKEKKTPDISIRSETEKIKKPEVWPKKRLDLRNK